MLLKEKWSEYLESYLELRKFPELTEKNYLVDLNQFIEFTVNNSYDPKDLTTLNLSKYSKVLDEKNYKDATFNRKLSSLNGFLEYLQDIGEVDEKVKNIIPLRENKFRESRFMDTEEVEILLRTINKPTTNILQKRDKLIIKTLLTTGLRLRELKNLDIKDIKGTELRIIGKGNKERKLNLPENLINEIKSYLIMRGDETETKIFTGMTGKPLSISGLRKIIKQQLEKSGLHDKGITPHTFRHTCGTILSENNISISTIQSIFGHSNPQTTNRYIHTSSQAKIEASECMNDIIW